MPEECGNAGTCQSAVKLVYVVGARIWVVQQGQKATQAAPDHPDFANGPAGKQNGQQNKQSHRQPLEAPLCVLVEHLSRLVHDLQPGVLLDGRVHVMLQKALQKACGGRQRVALWRLCQAQKVKLLRNPPLSSLQAGAL